ncbi:MAG: tRNA 2-thiouridine(34) synthase MnmA [Bacteroidaceae bacterium]|nr:tRNA 2-thiouridine(34) synthase MnmA [Bacteroidaceae bacterium]
MREKVLVGMSGGIDSTAACLLLMRQGYDVIGLTIWNHSPGMSGADTEPDYVTEARQMAAKLGVEHCVADEREAFDRDVAMPFARKWLDGLTPNPCVECNPLFKFRLLLEWADRLGCKYIATGHYAGIVRDGERCYIEQGKDFRKDQSYFLWKLGQEVLNRTLFPVGGMTKAEVRGYLAANGIELRHSKRESMEICFIESDYREYLRERIPDVDTVIGPGRFVDSNGVVIGQHKGYPYYTVGQRKGLNVAFGTPRYVLRTNPEKNTVMLGLPEQLETGYMLVSDLKPYNAELMKSPDLEVRIRYRSVAVPCTIVREVADNLVLVRFREPASAITPGQSAVFYIGRKVVGGAVITFQRGINQYICDYENTDIV